MTEHNDIIRALLVDDHRIILDGLLGLLGPPGVDVNGHGLQRRRALEMVGHLRWTWY